MLTFEENILDPGFAESVGKLKGAIDANIAYLDRIGQPYDVIFQSTDKETRNTIKDKENGN